jgi:hypothetical protein
LLQEAVRAPDGQIVQVITNTYMSSDEVQAGPFPDSYGSMTAADDPFAVKIRPLKQSVLSQDGVNFVNTTDQFDAHVRPVVQTESNSLGRARTLRTTYFDDTGRWILSQVARSTQSVGGVEIETERTEFDSMARPQRTYARRAAADAGLSRRWHARPPWPMARVMPLRLAAGSVACRRVSRTRTAAVPRCRSMTMAGCAQRWSPMVPAEASTTTDGPNRTGDPGRQ